MFYLAKAKRGSNVSKYVRSASRTDALQLKYDANLHLNWDLGFDCTCHCNTLDIVVACSTGRSKGKLHARKNMLLTVFTSTHPQKEDISFEFANLSLKIQTRFKSFTSQVHYFVQVHHASMSLCISNKLLKFTILFRLMLMLFLQR